MKTHIQKLIPLKLTYVNCLILISLCFLFYSCGLFPKDICEVIQNPSEYQDKITITGIVTESSGVLGYSVYNVKDKSKDCVLLVLSNKISPTPGNAIKVKGTLKEISNTDNNRRLIFIEEGVDFENIKALLSTGLNLLFKQ